MSSLMDMFPIKLNEYVSPFYYRDVFQHLRCVKTWYPTGSYFICDPQVTTTDKDFVVLVEGLLSDAEEQLDTAGYVYSSKDQEEYDIQGDDCIMCFRKGEVNLIVMNSDSLYKKWVDATELAKNMKLNSKDQRIRLFQYVLYGNTQLKGEVV